MLPCLTAPCLPLFSSIPCAILPCCGTQTTVESLVNRMQISAKAQQGFKDAMEDFCKSLSCDRTQHLTVMAFKKSVLAGFPEANADCVNAALQKIVNGVAAACPAFQQGLPGFIVALFRNAQFFEGTGDLLTCLLGPQEALRIQASFNDVLMQCIGQLIGSLFSSICPQQTGVCGNCCPVNEGNAPPTDLVFKPVPRC